MRIAEINLRTGVERELEVQAVWEGVEYLNWASANELLVAAQKRGEEKSQIRSVKFPGGATERVTTRF